MSTAVPKVAKGGSDPAAALAGAAVLVPVKDLTRTKTRLHPLLTLPERQHLAWLLLEGVLGELAGLPAPVRRVVVSSYAPAIDRARALGYEIIREERQLSESSSVDDASAALERAGVAGVLRIPLDLPWFSLEALHPLFRAVAAGARAVIVPSRDGTGTNALYRSPATLFPSRFGPGSRALHESEARQRTDAVQTLPIRALGLDIDDPADVAALLASGKTCAALDYLRGIEAPARLERIRRQPA